MSSSGTLDIKLRKQHLSDYKADNLEGLPSTSVPDSPVTLTTSMTPNTPTFSWHLIFEKEYSI